MLNPSIGPWPISQLMLFGFKLCLHSLVLKLKVITNCGVTMLVLLHLQVTQSFMLEQSILKYMCMQKVVDGTVDIGCVPIKDQVADIFTKPLLESRFLLLRDRLKLQELTRARLIF